jgi:hypothetical protein
VVLKASVWAGKLSGKLVGYRKEGQFAFSLLVEAKKLLSVHGQSETSLFCYQLPIKSGKFRNMTSHNSKLNCYGATAFALPGSNTRQPAAEQGQAKRQLRR